MSEADQKGDESSVIPKGQKYMDNLLLLFTISMLTGFLIFNTWGILQLLSVSTN
jgi:hypothetical protein